MEYNFDRSIGMLTMQISRGVGKQLKLAFQENNIDLEPLEWSVIAFLYANPQQSQNDIAKYLWTNKVMVNRILSNLESKGVIERITSATDKRYRKVNLSLHGTEIYANASKSASIAISNAINGLNNIEENALIDMLIRIKNNLSY